MDRYEPLHLIQLYHCHDCGLAVVDKAEHDRFHELLRIVGSEAHRAAGRSAGPTTGLQ